MKVKSTKFRIFGCLLVLAIILVVYVISHRGNNADSLNSQDDQPTQTQ